MAMPDPADHDPGCAAIETGVHPSLVIYMHPAPSGDTVLLVHREQCGDCSMDILYDTKREPWRRFHRRWRAELTVWVATWEHRHNLAGRAGRT